LQEAGVQAHLSQAQATVNQTVAPVVSQVNDAITQAMQQSGVQTQLNTQLNQLDAFVTEVNQSITPMVTQTVSPFMQSLFPRALSPPSSQMVSVPGTLLQMLPAQAELSTSPDQPQVQQARSGTGLSNVCVSTPSETNVAPSESKAPRSLVEHESDDDLYDEPVMIPSPIHESHVSAPVASQEEEDNNLSSPFVTQLALLHGMGFTDRAANISLLHTFRGDVSRVVNHLLNGGSAPHPLHRTPVLANFAADPCHVS
jgi:hypothetical protein